MKNPDLITITNFWYPHSLNKKVEWWSNFGYKVDVHKTNLALTDEQVLAIQADGTNVEFIIPLVQERDLMQQRLVAYRDKLIGGTNGEHLEPMSAFKAITPPTPVEAGIEDRLFIFVDWLRRERKTELTESIAKDLGIEYKSKEINANEYRAEILGLNAFEDCVEIKFQKDGVDGMAIYSSLDGVHFHLVDKVKYKPYKDMTKNEGDMPETRFYKIRAVYRDKEIGFFSEVKTVLCKIY